VAAGATKRSRIVVQRLELVISPQEQHREQHRHVSRRSLRHEHRDDGVLQRAQQPWSIAAIERVARPRAQQFQGKLALRPDSVTTRRYQRAGCPAIRARASDGPTPERVDNWTPLSPHGRPYRELARTAHELLISRGCPPRGRRGFRAPRRHQKARKRLRPTPTPPPHGAPRVARASARRA
jgi:hypothetical protein